MNLKKITTLAFSLLLTIPGWAQVIGSTGWVWMKGTDTTNKNGVYGVIGVSAPNNNPGGRDASGTWTDTAGRFWLFAGEGRHATGTSNARLNDLWVYDPTTNEWTWMHGDTSGNLHGVYGTQGVPDPGNKPGARYRMTTFTGQDGSLWLFGGQGRAATGAVQQSPLNDLWKYDVATNEWTWMKGDNTHYVNGVYGTKGQPDILNKPGTKEGATGWVDNDGNLWLFGGLGRAASSTSDGVMNDLWKYDIQTNTWTWVHGDSVIAPDSVYGTKGVAHPDNVPAGRRYASGWTDKDGNLWLFGGQNKVNQSFNDLWKYDIASNQWTWMHGDNGVNKFGEYGTLMESSPSNKPGSRISATAWQGPDNYFWLFGGSGYGTEIITSDPWALVYGYLNDLWLYDVENNEWTWVAGDTTFGVRGIYGTQGVADPDNKPGTRYLASGGWTDKQGSLWLFGGTGRSKNSNTDGRLNDLWRFDVCFYIPDLEDIGGIDTICRNTVATYTIDKVPHATGYEWILPTGWTGSSDSNSITVTTGTTGGTISVFAFSHCDTSATQSFQVVVPEFNSAQIKVDSNILSTTFPYAAYKWYKNGDSIPGATHDTLVVTENGSYSVKVVDIYGCEDSSIAYVVDNVGVGTFGGHSELIVVYPNPTDRQLFIKMQTQQQLYIGLWSSQGEKVLEKEYNGPIDVSRFASGLYFIKIMNKEGERLYQGSIMITPLK